eukprot:8566140-Lingulodinium_polyedra.AAC.1
MEPAVSWAMCSQCPLTIIHVETGTRLREGRRGVGQIMSHGRRWTQRRAGRGRDFAGGGVQPSQCT